MNKDSIIRIIDQSSIKRIKDDNIDISDLIKDLKTRSNNIFKVLTNEKLNADPKILSIRESDIENMNLSKRVIYAYYYINQAAKRINDLKWILLNKDKFDRYSDIQLYNLIIFKDKLS
jgi:hypothetical protein